ncbi:MAG: RNA methyltransferase [Acidobacteria bacterium]|nr:RNA methyltransferase [Acidobacteriota bacterium]
MTDPTITSRRHPVVARCRDAADGHAGEHLLDGPHLVTDALAAALPLAFVLVAEGADARQETAAIVDRARVAGCLIHRVTPAVLDAASPTRTPAGILALVTLHMRDIQDLLFPAPALVTVAVDVQDPGNLGTLIRSTEAAGGTGLVAAGHSAHPFGWKALRGSMGSSLRLPIARAADTRGALTALRDAGLHLVALAADAPTSLDDADLSGPVAVLAGSEGAGLSTEVAALCDVRVRIPMHAGVESLNVGVAASLVLFDVARRRRSHQEFARE